jgi:hypothetical protein
MTNLSVLLNQTDSKTLDDMIKETLAALASMPAELGKQATAELIETLAEPAFMMIAGQAKTSKTAGSRLYWVMLADFIDNYDLWYNCLRHAPPAVSIRQ